MSAKPVKMLPRKLAALLVALREGEYTSRELADVAGLHYLTALDYLRALHQANLIFVSKWEKDALGRQSVPIYKLGLMDLRWVDVPRPRLTKTEQQRKYRKRKVERVAVNVLENRVATVMSPNQEAINATFDRAFGTPPVFNPAPPAPPGGWAAFFQQTANGQDDTDDNNDTTL